MKLTKINRPGVGSLIQAIMTSNPYSPPSSPVHSDRGSAATAPRPFSRLSSVAMMIGAGTGTAIYWGYAALFEILVMPNLVEPGEEMLSHGQQFGLIATPLAAILGTVAGLSVAFVSRNRILTGVGIGLLGSLLVATAVLLLWQSSVARYGSDPSDYILYVPLVAGSLAVACIGLISSLAVSMNDVLKRRRLG